MKMVPTSVNMLPARLVWCVSQPSKDKLASMSSGIDGPKIRAAPFTVIIEMDIDFHEHLSELFSRKPAVRDHFSDTRAREASAFRNSSLQGAYFIMAARALGLNAGPRSGFDNAAVDATFFIDASPGPVVLHLDLSVRRSHHCLCSLATPGFRHVQSDRIDTKTGLREDGGRPARHQLMQPARWRGAMNVRLSGKAPADRQRASVTRIAALHADWAHHHAKALFDPDDAATYVAGNKPQVEMSDDGWIGIVYNSRRIVRREWSWDLCS